jgi:hypothetical protein
MVTILLVLTVVSLAAAVVLGAAAWRLSREARVRSAARIAALAAAADADDESESPRMMRPGDVIAPVARVSPAVALASSVAPASSVGAVSSAAPASSVGPVSSVALAASVTPIGAPWAPARVTAPLGDEFLGSSLAAPSGRGQRGLAIAAAVLFVTILVGGYYTVFGGGTSSAGAPASVGGEAPLELVSLRHERQNAGLAITGLVRNPVSGGAVEKLAAVVFLFDQQGAFVKSSRADVDFTRLAPGDESPFVITLDAPSNVARYRVSFRNDAGVVPHIDRRGQEPIARDTP